MKKIASFTVNHESLKKGLYVSREDGDVLTCDLRMCAPYKDALLSNSQIHSLEHLLATVLRNSPVGANVVYVGPMGCQTGFYVLFRGIDKRLAVETLKNAFGFIASSDNLAMPGSSKKECGNCLNLDTDAAKRTASDYYNIIKNKDGFDVYPN